MSDTNKKDEDNLLHFPDLEKRQKNAEKEAEKQRKKQKHLEAEYRRQYRTTQQITGARKNNNKNTMPLVNWHNIPPFSGACIAAFLIVHLITSLLLDDAQRLALYMSFGFTPAYYTGALPWIWSAAIAPVTTTLIHGSWMHLLMNCVMMMAMGAFFERTNGIRITLIFFIFCTLCGDLTYLAINPATPTPVVGASGAISGLFGAVLMMMNANGMTGVKQRRGPLPLIALWIAIMLGTGLLSADTAWQSHIGGFLGGITLYHLWSKGKVRL